MQPALPRLESITRRLAIAILVVTYCVSQSKSQGLKALVEREGRLMTIRAVSAASDTNWCFSQGIPILIPIE